MSYFSRRSLPYLSLLFFFLVSPPTAAAAVPLGKAFQSFESEELAQVEVLLNRALSIVSASKDKGKASQPVEPFRARVSFSSDKKLEGIRFEMKKAPVDYSLIFNYQNDELEGVQGAFVSRESGQILHSLGLVDLKPFLTRLNNALKPALNAIEEFGRKRRATSDSPKRAEIMWLGIAIVKNLHGNRAELEECVRELEVVLKPLFPTGATSVEAARTALGNLERKAQSEKAKVEDVLRATEEAVQELAQIGMFMALLVGLFFALLVISFLMLPLMIIFPPLALILVLNVLLLGYIAVCLGSLVG